MEEVTEEPIANDETGSIKVKEKEESLPNVDTTEGNVTKAKMVPEQYGAEEQTITKVDLSNPPQQNEVVDEVATLEEVLEEVTESEVEEIENEVEEAVAESIETGQPLPENIQKLVDFMEDTGGDINDYVKLNQDYSDLNDEALLKEYYTQTKPHLNKEEINFLMDDQFSYDEDTEDDRDIRRKKLALKEQVADAKSHLDGQKSKYYEEIKMGSKLPEEAQKAMDFFSRYNKESKETNKHSELQSKTFTQKTNEVFNDQFKGFEYKVGEKRYRFNVSDADSVKSEQGSINNFVGKFLDKNNLIKDAHGYHKSLFTANNADAVANHFYEQGRADALKDSIANSKNIDMAPRQLNKSVEVGGIKYKVLGNNSSDFKFKIKNK